MEGAAPAGSGRLSRFLARALAMVAAEADAPAKAPDPALGGVLGVLVIGEWVSISNPFPSSSLSAPGALPGVLEVEAGPSPPWRLPAPIAPHDCYWPDVRLAALIAEGATPMPCPHGGLDWERPCGRMAWFSSSTMLRLHAAGLVPAGVAGWGAG